VEHLEQQSWCSIFRRRFLPCSQIGSLKKISIWNGLAREWRAGDIDLIPRLNWLFEIGDPLCDCLLVAEVPDRHDERIG
jgi:hypothetical protein